MKLGQTRGLRMVPPGSILFPKSGASTLLNHRVILEVPAFIVSHLAAVVPTNSVTGEYLYFFLRTVDMARWTQTTTLPSLRLSAIRDIRVPLPPILVQRRIVEILSMSDGIRAKCRRAERLVSAATRALFSRFMAAHQDQVRIRTVSEVLAEPPANGRSPSKKGLHRAEVLTLSAVTQGRIDLGESKVAAFASADLARFLVREGDAFVVRGNGNIDLLGRIGIHDGPDAGVIYPDTLIRLRFDAAAVLNDYIRFVWDLPIVREHIVRRAKTTSGTHKINQQDVLDIRFPWLPLEKQRALQEMLVRLESVRVSSSESGATSAAALASLSARAFSGELTADWERQNAEEIAAHQRVHEELPRLVLVGLLNAAQREARRRAVMLTALMKYAFVFQMQNRTRQRLYAFRPYKYGPFASEIYDHLGVLEADGLVRQREGGRSGEREWHRIELTRKGRAYAEELLPAFDPDLVEELAAVAREYGPLEHDALLDRVYEEYPEFARKSVRGRRGARAGSPGKSPRRRR